MATSVDDITALAELADFLSDNLIPLSNLSVAQLQPIVLAAEDAYATLVAGLQSPVGINLDAPSGNTALEGFNNFITEANLVAIESDVQQALAYLGRIVGNLTAAGG